MNLGFCEDCLAGYQRREACARTRRATLSASLAASLVPFGLPQWLREQVGDVGATYAQLAEDDPALATQHFLEVVEEALREKSMQ